MTGSDKSYPLHASRSPTSSKKRPEVCGPHAPERPYPIYLRGEVERGFGRGSKDLGCPTANLPSKVIGPGSLLNRTGVYFGFARVLPQDPDDPCITDSEVDDSNPTSVDHCPKKDEHEDNEVVLGASPLGDKQDGFPHHKTKQSISASGQALLQPSDKPEKEAEVSMFELQQKGHNLTCPVPPSASSVLPPAAPPTNSSSAVTSQTVSSSSATAAVPTTESGTGSSFSSSSRRRKKKRVTLNPQDYQVFPMVMSVGWNPFYKNTHKTAEVHILHPFSNDFYGLEIRVVVLGYIRPEYNYDSMDALIEDIEMDKTVTLNSLARPHYQDYSDDPFLGLRVN